MITVNSLSGGKTSSYLAVHYPSDLEIFALVCVDCHNAAGPLKRDKKLVQMVNDKLSYYVPIYGEFRATTEDPQTIRVMFDLEQKLGREIKWVRGISWETMMDQRQAIPNISMRFCTYELKIKPIFEYLFLRGQLPVKMRMGYRWDEMERKQGFKESIRYQYCGHIVWDPEEVINPIIRRNLQEHSNGYYYYHEWEEMLWRTGEFPLIDDKISHPVIVDYWKDQGLTFPQDSNCQNCFWKHSQQQRMNFENNFAIMQWASLQEIIRGNRFKKEISLETVKRSGLQLDFFFGTGSGCQAGFCTD